MKYTFSDLVKLDTASSSGGSSEFGCLRLQSAEETFFGIAIYAAKKHGHQKNKY